MLARSNRLDGEGWLVLLGGGEFSFGRFLSLLALGLDPARFLGGAALGFHAFSVLHRRQSRPCPRGKIPVGEVA